MSKPLRIAYGRLCQETNAFSPVPTTLEDFRRMHLLEGDALHRATGRLGAEVPGMIRNAELSGFRAAARRAGGVEAVPLVSAWAVPGGPMTEETYRALRDRLVASLRAAGPVDGVFLSLHGALRAQGAERDPEAGLLAAVREVVGPAPIAASFDLHGNLTRAKVEPLTVLQAYRTNPHRDLAATGRRAGEVLIRALRGEVRPTTAWRSLPMLLGGGDTIDLFRPMRPIFKLMTSMERDRRVLTSSLFMCHPFNDSPDLGWSVHVTTDDDQALADRLADELAERAWSVKDIPPPKFLTPTEGIQAAREARCARRLGTCCVVDVSDVVGAGSTGENTNLLAALLKEGQGLLSYVPVRDASVVEALWSKPAGARVSVEVGGKLDPARNPAVAVEGALRARADTVHSGRACVLDLGHVQLVVTERAPLPLKPSFYGDLGLSPWRADLVVVKNFFHYRIYYLAMNRKSIPIMTRGATDLGLASTIPTNDPVHPRDPVADWRPADRRRRGLAGAAPQAALVGV